MSTPPKGETDPIWTLMFLLGMILFAGWLVWTFLHNEILYVFRYVRLLEILPFTLFDSHAAACAKWLWHSHPVDVPINAETFRITAACFGPEVLRGTSAEKMEYILITPTSMAPMTDIVAYYYRWIVLAAAGAFAFHGIYYAVFNKFKVRHNLESFIAVQAKMWPVITPIVKFSPTKFSARVPGAAVPQKLPCFAEALSPEEWISFHRIPVTNGIPERERVRRAFVHQLGPRWNGVDSLPNYMLVLFAAFALKGAQSRDESDDFLGKIAMCWTQAGGFRPTPEVLSEAKKIARDPEVGGKALAIAANHAYRTTAIIGVLKWARQMGGVLAPAQFVWLRGVDREFWYALNNQGRRAFHTEGAGAQAHFMAEEAAGKALPMPRVDTAIVTINQYLAANQSVIPPREGSPAKAK